MPRGERLSHPSAPPRARCTRGRASADASPAPAVAVIGRMIPPTVPAAPAVALPAATPPPPAPGPRPAAPPRRSSPERPPPPRRLDEKPLPPPAAALVACAERRWSTDVLLEAGRLAAHYLVVQGVLPEHVLHAREDPSPKQHHVLHARDDPKLGGTRAICEVSEILGDPPGEHACDSLPDLVGQMSQQAYYDPPDNQVQDKHADENQHLEDDQVLLNQGIGMHDLDKNYQNSEQMLVNQRANEHGHGDQQPESEQMLLNNEEAMLKKDAEEQVENEQLLPHPATDVNHRIKEEQMLLDDVTVVHDLDHCDLNGEQMLVNDDSVNKSAVDGAQLKDGQMLVDRAAKRQATLRSLGNGQMMIPIINLDDDDDDDDYAEQPDTREFLEPKTYVFSRRASRKLS